MKSCTQKAKLLLEKEDYTFVAVKGESEIVSRDRGVKPLIDLIDNHALLTDFCVADKVVGKGAAILYSILGVDELYCAVISDHAFDFLQSEGISVFYGQKVDAIVNRDKTGFCPIESAVISIFDKKEGEKAIRNALLRLKTNK